MSWWGILLLVLLALFLLGQLRIGAQVWYDREGVRVTVIAGPARIRVYPPRRRKASRRRAEKREKQAPDGWTARQGGTTARLLKLLPVACEAAGALRRKILVHHLDLKVVWGAPDAAAAAIGYGRAHALIGMLWPIFDHNFRVRAHKFQVDVDYQASCPEVALDLALSLTLSQAVAFALHYGGKAMMRWSGSARRPQQKQEA